MIHECNCHHHAPRAHYARVSNAAVAAKTIDPPAQSDVAEITPAIGKPKVQPSQEALKTQAGATALESLVPFPGLPTTCLPAVAALAEKHDPEKVTHVLYHGGCRDGFGAAWAAWQKLGENAEYIPMAYQSKIPDLPSDARVAIVDFSLPREQMMELKDKVADVVVLDHHKSAAENLEGLDFAVFEMERAGAGLAWHYFNPGQPLPEKLAHLELRDLWKFDQIPGTKEVDMAASTYLPKKFGPGDHHFQVLRQWDELTIDQLKSEGAEAVALMDKEVERATATAHFAEIDGHRVPVVNTSLFMSDVGNALVNAFPDAPFVGIYYDKGNGTRKWSLRSGGFDVSEICAKFGGGGHEQAGGFRESTERQIQVGAPDGPPDDNVPKMPRRSKEQKTTGGRRLTEVQVARAASQTQWGELDGHRVPMVNCHGFKQDIADYVLAQDKFESAPFVGVYHRNEDGTREWALYSRGSTDVKEIAAKFGGGGTEDKARFLELKATPVKANPE